MWVEEEEGGGLLLLLSERVLRDSLLSPRRLIFFSFISSCLSLQSGSDTHTHEGCICARGRWRGGGER